MLCITCYSFIIPAFCFIPYSIIPKLDCLDLGKEEESVDMERLFEIRKQFWLDELDEIEKYFNDQINEDLPQRIRDQLNKLRERVNKMEG